MTQQWGNDRPAQWPAPGTGSGGGPGQHPGHPGGWGPPGFHQPPWGQGQAPGQGQPWGQAYAQGRPWPQQPGQPWPQPQAPWGQPPQQDPWNQRPQPGPWGQPTPTPPRRRGGMGRVIAFALGAVILGAIGLALMSSLSRPTYQNEDYTVPQANSAPPQIPLPETIAEAEQRLTANPLYRQKVASPVRCDMPEIDVLTASDPALKAHFEGQMACLMRVWGPAFDATGTWQLYRPTVTIYGQSVSTPCGQQKGANAMYCPANQQLYYSRDLARAKQLPTLSRPKMVDLVMAHEFGHAIQGRAGITGGELAKRVIEKPSKTDTLWMSRRMEVQADCLSGMWVRSVAQSRDIDQQDLQNFYATLESLGDDRLGAPDGQGNHGVATTRRYWGQLGMSTNDIGTCNTWTVPREQVR